MDLKKWLVVKVIGSLLLLAATVYLVVGMSGMTAMVPAVIVFVVVLIAYGLVCKTVRDLSKDIKEIK